MRFTTLLLCLALPALAQGQQVYRSVDAEGNVSFSDKPPPEARDLTTVDVTPRRQPSDADVAEAQRRNEQLKAAGERSERRRLQEQAVRNDALLQAQRNLNAAEAALAHAKIQRDSDWQGKAGGGRRLRPEYFERVEQAEADVVAARKQLDRLKAENP